MKLNKEELIIGSIFGAVPIFWIHWYALATIPICAFLWALSGAGQSKLYRRLGCPMVVSLVMFLNTNHWRIFWFILAGFGILCTGYGIPDGGDKGSWLGRFWFKTFPKYANFLTRVTIYMALAISFLCLSGCAAVQKSDSCGNNHRPVAIMEVK